MKSGTSDKGDIYCELTVDKDPGERSRPYLPASREHVANYATWHHLSFSVDFAASDQAQICHALLRFTFPHARPSAQLPVPAGVCVSSKECCVRVCSVWWRVPPPFASLQCTATVTDFDSGVAPIIFRYTSILQTCILYYLSCITRRIAGCEIVRLRYSVMGKTNRSWLPDQADQVWLLGSGPLKSFGRNGDGRGLFQKVNTFSAMDYLTQRWHSLVHKVYCVS